VKMGGWSSFQVLERNETGKERNGDAARNETEERNGDAASIDEDCRGMYARLMARKARIAPGGLIYHVMNRTAEEKNGDVNSFERRATAEGCGCGALRSFTAAAPSGCMTVPADGERVSEISGLFLPNQKHGTRPPKRSRTCAQPPL
jgi:hypothetical protein